MLSGQAEEARRWLVCPSRLWETEPLAPDILTNPDGRFQFRSPLPSVWPENNVVHGIGRLPDEDWRGRPTVILVHGWNAELAYQWLFPWVARELNKQGLNGVMVELPLHGQRRPRSQRVNFLSGDLTRTIQATAQAVMDLRALISWIRTRSDSPVALWGFSLGAWLVGLVACTDARLNCAVLATPVVDLERAISELKFCQPIRESCQSLSLWPSQLNLKEYAPRLPGENILLLQANYDLFAPGETVEEIHQRWKGSEIWREPYGHVSVLMARGLLRRVAAWLAKHPAMSVRSDGSGLFLRPGLGEASKALPEAGE